MPVDTEDSACLNSPDHKLERLNDLYALFEKSQMLLDKQDDEEEKVFEEMHDLVNPLGEKVELDMIAEEEAERTLQTLRSSNSGEK